MSETGGIAGGGQSVGVLGASSLVGRLLLPQLVQSGCQVTAFSRSASMPSDDGVEWRQLPEGGFSQTRSQREERGPDLWICLAPIWVLPEYFALLEACGVRRVVSISSTSRFTKSKSTNLEEKRVAKRLAGAELQLQTWAEAHDVEWIILRPTLIYGMGRDKNIAEIARFIRRFGFFPLLGEATGLRQPIHADDVASACIAALLGTDAANRAYNISGREVITYRQMVVLIFKAMGRYPRFITIPLWVFRMGVALLRLVPHCRSWSVEMVERMNSDLVFDHSEAVRDFGFNPRHATVSREDVGE